MILVIVVAGIVVLTIAAVVSVASVVASGCSRHSNHFLVHSRQYIIQWLATAKLVEQKACMSMWHPSHQNSAKCMLTGHCFLQFAESIPRLPGEDQKIL